MAQILALIGTRRTKPSDVEGVVRFHLDEAHSAFWSNVRHDHYARGTRVAAKVAGAGVLALTGQLDCLRPHPDPLEADGERWEWRYDVRWDPSPRRFVPVAELGPPFSEPTRSTRRITWADFVRAYRSLHGQEPPQQ